MADISRGGTRLHNLLLNRNFVGQHSSESAGVLSPYSINHLDVGLNWFNTGASSEVGNNPVRAVVDLGNGIAMAGSTLGIMFRSQNYGKDWVTFAAPSGDDISGFAYVGNGNLWIITTGNVSGTSNLFRSLNFGNRTFFTVLAVGGVNFVSTAYIGNGVGLVTDFQGNAYRTTNFGGFWVPVAGNPQTPGIPLNTIGYLENGIVLLGANDGRVLRSVNKGVSFSSVGTITLGAGIRTFAYLSNGLVLAGDDVGFVYTSTDFGLTWSSGVQVTIPPNTLRSLLYVGNGVVLAFQGGDGANIFRNADYGASGSWTNLGSFNANPGFFLCSAYLGNGVVIAGTNGTVPFPGPIAGTIFRSDVAFKFDESQNDIRKRIETFTVDAGLNFTHRTVLMNASVGNRIVSLPSAGITGTIDLRGHQFDIKKIDATANTVTVTPAGAETIDGAAVQVLNVQYQSISIKSDGSNWWII